MQHRWLVVVAMLAAWPWPVVHTPARAANPRRALPFERPTEGQAPQAMLLRLRFTPGETLRYALQQTMTMEMTLEDRSFSSTFTMAMDLSTKAVAGEPGGAWRLEQTITGLRFHMDLPPPMEGNFHYDTTRPAEGRDGPLGELLSTYLDAMVGNPFSLTMDSRGNITDVRLPEAVKAALQDHQVLAQVGAFFTEEHLRRMMTDVGVRLPLPPVHPGARWAVTQPMKMPFGSQTLAMDLTYDGPTGTGLYAINGTLHLTMNMDGAPLPMTLEIADQQGTVALLLDNDRGVLVRSHIDQRLTMHIVTAGQAMTMHTNTQVRFDLVE